MQKLTGGAKQVQVSGSSVRQLVANLDKEFPGLKNLLYDEQKDRIKPEVAVVIDGEVSRLGLLEHVAEDSEVHFLPAIAGGTHLAHTSLKNLYP